MKTEAEVLSKILDAAEVASFLISAAQLGSRILMQKRAEGREHFTEAEEAALDEANAKADADYERVRAGKLAAAGG